MNVPNSPALMNRDPSLSVPSATYFVPLTRFPGSFG